MWELDYKESWALKNWWFWTVVLEKTLESPLDCKEIQPVHPKGNQCWIFIRRTDAEAETPTLWPPDPKNRHILKRPWCWERLKSGGEGDNRGCDHWIPSLTQWTWVWASSGSWWWTGKSGVQQSMGSQRVGHDWVTELNWRQADMKMTSYLEIRGTVCHTGPQTEAPGSFRRWGSKRGMWARAFAVVSQGRASEAEWVDSGRTG